MMERAYCLSCRREMVTESGQVCAKCAKGQVGVTRKTGCRMTYNTREGMGALAWGVAAFLAAMLVVGLWAITGCTTGQLEREIDRIKDDVTPTTTTTTTTTTQPPKPPDGYTPKPGDVQRFLWKPVSESNGRLVVITPAWVTADRVVIAGTHTKTPDPARANGNRLHFRLPNAGSAYGNNVRVEAMLGTKVVKAWTVPQDAARYDVASTYGWRRMFQPFMRKSMEDDDL